MLSSAAVSRNSIAAWILTAALAFVFGLFGFEKFSAPVFWIQWVPAEFEGLLGLTRDAWLSVAGAFELLLAALVLIPVRAVRRIGAALMILHLLTIVMLTGWSAVAVRDIGLLLSGVALLVLL